MEKIFVSIPGGNGRMGKTLLGLIIENEKFEIASATCLPNENEVGIDIGLLTGKAKISKQINSDQFINANITFKEIEVIKKVLINKLINIFHIRIEYPQ